MSRNGETVRAGSDDYGFYHRKSVSSSKAAKIALNLQHFEDKTKVQTLFSQTDCGSSEDLAGHPAR
jgi:hypothetical protein